MAVIEEDAHGVIAHRLQPRDLDVLLAAHRHLLAGGMALHFGAGAFDAQIFGGKLKTVAILESDGERRLRRIETDLAGPDIGAHDRSASESSRASPSSMIGTPLRMG